MLVSKMTALIHLYDDCHLAGIVPDSWIPAPLAPRLPVAILKHQHWDFSHMDHPDTIPQHDRGQSDSHQPRGSGWAFSNCK